MFFRNVGSRLDSDVAKVPGKKKMDPQADLDELLTRFCWWSFPVR